MSCSIAGQRDDVPLLVALDSVTDPAEPGGRAIGGGIGAHGWSSRTAGSRHDRGCVKASAEGGAAASGPAEPDPAIEAYREAGCRRRLANGTTELADLSWPPSRSCWSWALEGMGTSRQAPGSLRDAVRIPPAVGPAAQRRPSGVALYEFYVATALCGSPVPGSGRPVQDVVGEQRYL
jgi:hypothetical protein